MSTYKIELNKRELDELKIATHARTKEYDEYAQSETNKILKESLIEACNVMNGIKKKLSNAK